MWNDFVVNSIDCVQCQEWDNHTYDRLNSTTSNFTLENTSISLGANNVQGYIGTDRVCWKNRTDYCVENVKLFEALDYTNNYIPPISHNFGGFLGLAPIQTGLGWADAPPLIERMFEEHWIDRRQVTLWFRYKHAGSGLIFGNHDYSYYRGGITYNFTYTPEKGFTDEQPPDIWGIKLDKVVYSNNKNTTITSGNDLAVIDSDQKDIWVPKEHFAIMAEQIS